MKKRRYKLRELQCTECGFVTYAAKRIGVMTKRGHIKTMYCPMCRKERDFVQTGWK